MNPILPLDTVAVWRTSLEISPERQIYLFRLLSPDEKERARRFRFESDRRHYTMARATLRRLLGHYLECPPASLEFHYGKQGKPWLKCPPGRDSVYFNVSHSADIALYAFSRSYPVGIDLEQNRTDFLLDELTALICSRAEAAVLSRLSVPARWECFYRFWTRKEAYCKVTGDGLTQDVRHIDTSALPSTPSPWFPICREGVPERRILLRDLTVDDGYCAALAVAGAAIPVTRHDWIDDLTEIDLSMEANGERSDNGGDCHRLST